MQCRTSMLCKLHRHQCFSCLQHSTDLIDSQPLSVSDTTLWGKQKLLRRRKQTGHETNPGLQRTQLGEQKEGRSLQTLPKEPPVVWVSLRNNNPAFRNETFHSDNITWEHTWAMCPFPTLHQDLTLNSCEMPLTCLNNTWEDSPVVLLTQQPRELRERGVNPEITTSLKAEWCHFLIYIHLKPNQSHKILIYFWMKDSAESRMKLIKSTLSAINTFNHLS